VAVGFKAKIEVIPAAQATQIIYIQHSRALAVDQFAGRDSAVQAFQVLFGQQGLMNPGRQTPPELLAALDKVSRTPLDSPDYPKVFVRGSLATPVGTDVLTGPALERLDIPVLLVHGAADPVAPLTPVRDIARRLPAAELAIVPGAPHDVLNDATHRIVAAHIVQWLERLRGGPALTVERSAAFTGRRPETA
jgi:pimeloyl-ACP methyl ester carboxylesterase